MPKVGKLKGTTYRDALKKELERAPKPKLSEVAANFIKLAGGPQQFAKHLWDEYNLADGGSLARQRIMALIVQCLKQDEEVFDPAALDEMEDQDLQALFRTLNETVGQLDGDPEQHTSDRPAEGAEQESKVPASEGQEDPGEGEEGTGGAEEDAAEPEGEEEDWPAPAS